jgi:NitT/TauT family transport system substrate-binding protein
MKKIFLVLAAVLLFSAACGANPPDLTPVQFALGYIPNIQFAPVYMAIANGRFADEGLEVEIVHMEETQSAALVGANDLQFAVVSGEQVLLARAQGLPVVYVAAWFQQYPVSVVSDASLGIEAPSDLAGRTIGLPGLYGANYIGLRALLHAGGLDESDVTLESIGYTQVEAFTTGRNPIISAYTTNEPIQLRSLGAEVSELRVSDYLNLAANGLITNEQTIAENPELVRRMVNAFLNGLLDTIADPAQAYQVSMGFVEGLQADDPVQEQVLATSIELWSADRPGYADPQAWENMQTTLLEMGLLSAPLDLSKAYSNAFVP